MVRTLLEKLEILADAAKYDVSCASSGGAKRNARSGGLGSVTGAGICHAYTPDGRCVSLLKILMTNFCIYDCSYCVSRRSSNVERARFTPDEIVTLTLDLYRRNCIEGLFLSSGIARSVDETMGDLIRVVRALREDHDFRGYIHLKTIPGASEGLIAEAGRHADRLSMNIELPTEISLKALAPEKSVTSIKQGMAAQRTMLDDAEEAKAARGKQRGKAKPPRFAPAGHSTQMVVGADAVTDATIVRASANLYSSYGLKRVYYSAFSPNGHPSSLLSTTATPLIREHRLYQADWLLRFYGFNVDEVAGAMASEMLDHRIDPKLAWALQNRARFPVDVNKADREALLRVPGLGTRAVDGIIRSRRSGALRLDDIGRLTRGVERVRPFIVTADYRPGAEIDDARLRKRLTPRPEQLQLL